MMLAMMMDYNRTFAENAKEAGIVTLLGMVAIFAVLAILWGVIEILHRAFNLPVKRKAKKAEASAPLVEAVAPAVDEPAETDDGAIVAAITAAITAARAEEGNSTGFRVVSFRRTTR